ncbi:MAG TPA: hypothetical protein VF159_09325, partial [Gemmatimonadaceae bacterium]
YGRGIWVLDDYTRLRQLASASSTGLDRVRLFAPDEAVRLRRNVNADTPFPPEVPHALNAPDGALIYYALPAKPAGVITLDVLDAAGHVVRHLSSSPIPPVEEAAHPPEPDFWIARPMPLSTDVGTNRANWDLRYDAPPAFSHSFEINANPGLTPASPEGPLAAPGRYTITLTVDGRRYTQTLTVRNDPRSPATPTAVAAQSALLLKIYGGIGASWQAYQAADALRKAVQSAAGANPPTDIAAAVAALGATLDSVAGSSAGGRGPRGRRGATPAPNFRTINGTLVGQLEAQDNGDMAPTAAMLAAYASACHDLSAAEAAFDHMLTNDLPTLDAALTHAGLRPVASPRTRLVPPRC